MPRAMKDSGIKWIGVIPVEWETVQLKRIARIITGNTPSKVENDKYYSQDFGYLWIKAEDLGNIKPIEKTTEYLTEEGKETARLFPSNTVFVCCIASVGKVGFCNVPASCNQQINGLIFHGVYWKYGFYVTSAQESEYINNASGNVMKIINSDKQSRLICPLPPLEEQQRIATFLDGECARIDNVIEKTRASIVEYKKLKQAIITRAVTKGMRPARPMKDSGVEWLGDIPADWEIIKLKYISRFMQTKYSKDDGQLNYIGLENVVGWSGAFIKTDSVYDLDQSLICEAGDILFGKLRPYLAKVYLNTSKQCCSGEFVVIRIDDSMCKRFFWYQLMSHGFIFTVDSSTYGTKMPRANAEYIKNISVVIPPLEEQKEIAAYLDGKTAAIDSLIEKKGRLVTELERLKKSLIFEYVTGKKEAPERT